VRHDAVAIVIPLPIVAAIRIVTDFLHSDRQPSLPRISNRSSYRASLINRTDRIAETQSSQVSLPSKFVGPFCISFTAFFALVSIHNANSCNEVNKEREREREREGGGKGRENERKQETEFAHQDSRELRCGGNAIAAAIDRSISR